MAGLSFESPDLGGFCRVLIDLATGDPGLDRSALKSQLSEQGYSDVLRGLLDRRVYDLGPFARAETPLAEAHRAWCHVLALHRERRLQVEAEGARQQLAEEMSEENLARLRATQDFGREEREGELEGVETARPDGLNENS